MRSRNNASRDVKKNNDPMHDHAVEEEVVLLSSLSSSPLSIDKDDCDSELESNDLIDDNNGNDDISYDDDTSYDDDHDNENNHNEYKTKSTPWRKPIHTPRLFQTHPHLAVLPVLLLEFLALAMTRAVLPSLLLQRYGNRTYIVMGAAECARGVLAFFACPVFGKVSDLVGRRKCLLVTVLGTLGPVCSLAFWRVDADSDYYKNYYDDGYGYDDGVGDGTNNSSVEFDSTLNGMTDAGDPSEGGSWYSIDNHNHYDNNIHNQNYIHDYYITTHHLLSTIHRIDIFVALFALSGMFSSTFTLTFAYISDVVKDRDGRVAAYGLALATFGLSFTIGPLLGGYLANSVEQVEEKMMEDDGLESSVGGKSGSGSGSGNGSDIHPLGQHRVFMTTLLLAILDLFYIHFILPESLNDKRDELEQTSGLDNDANGTSNGYHAKHNDNNEDTETMDGDTTHPSSTAVAATSSTSNVPLPAGIGVSRRASSSWWNPLESIRYLASDPLLSTIGRVTFLYYTALHAVVSTLVLYAARQFRMGPHQLGELMAALGLSTMVSEAVLVRVAIPSLGEKMAMRVGLASFALQCVLLAVADRPWHLFACAFLAIPGNLVYPSISSLVSATVRPEMVGRALGAVNGVKSLTEGVVSSCGIYFYGCYFMFFGRDLII